MLADHARTKALHLALAVALAASSAAAKSPRVAVARRGKALMPILAGSAKAPAEELRRYLDAISGARFEIRQPQPGAHGLYVGLAADFPGFKSIPRSARKGISSAARGVTSC